MESKSLRSLWIKAQLKAPPVGQRNIIPRLYETKEIIHLLGKSFPIHQLHGEGKGGPLAVTYFGLGDYKPFILDRVFIEKPIEKKVGRLPLWRCNEVIDTSPSDIVIIEAAKHLFRKLRRQNAICLPQMIYHILDVHGDWQDVRKRFRKSVRYELRLTRKYGYEYDISHRDEDFAFFYHRMYVPTMTSRHRDLATPYSIAQAYQRFQHGFIFWVNRDGRRVCGSVCYVDQDVVHFFILGVLNADEQLYKEGVIGALNSLRIQWANQAGYKAVNFRGTSPFMQQGSFHYKRKWGASVYIPPHKHRRIWIKINHGTHAVSKYLTENPCVIVDTEDNLHGLITVDNVTDVTVESKEKWKKNYATPGLKSLIIRSVEHFTHNPTNADHPEIVVPTTPVIAETGQ